MEDDFGHRLLVDKVSDGERIELVADDVERSAIAERLRLVALERLEANAALERREGGRVRARGRVRATLEQRCVATGDPVVEHVDEPFDLIFRPEPQPDRAEEEVELAQEDCDVIFYDGGAIDLGSAIADTLALAMNPYPRSAGAEAVLREAGVLAEEQAGPFAALAKLKKGGDEA